MSTKTVCDSCGETITDKPLITSTENDGQVFEFDSAACFIDWRKTRP